MSGDPATGSVVWYLQQGVLLFGMSKLDDPPPEVIDAIRAMTDPEQLKRVLMVFAAASDWNAVIAALPGTATATDAPIILEEPRDCG